MKNVATLKRKVDELRGLYTGTTAEWIGSKWSNRGCMEHVKFDHYKGSWIKPPLGCKSFAPLTQIKQFKATLDKMVGVKLAVKYSNLALRIPKHLEPMQRYLILCQWRAIWNQPAYVYLFNHYVEHGIKPLHAMFILQMKAPTVFDGYINMPIPAQMLDKDDNNVLTRWCKVWNVKDDIAYINSATESGLDKNTDTIKDAYNIGEVKEFIKANSKDIPQFYDIIGCSVGDRIKICFCGVRDDAVVEQIGEDTDIINPYTYMFRVKLVALARTVSIARHHIVKLIRFLIKLTNRR